MTAAGGVGDARLQWFLTHVRMIPYRVGELMTLAQREHERMTAALALVRNRNRNLPEIALSKSREEQEAKVAATDRRLREFLVREQIVTIPDYVGPLGANTPYIERPNGPNFWEKIQFRDPIPDHLHEVFRAIASTRRSPSATSGRSAASSATAFEPKAGQCIWKKP